MNGEFAAKFIWACAFLFVYTLAGEIFIFKILKINLTNSRRTKSPQLIDQSTRKYIPIFAFLLYQQIHFNQIKLKMAMTANNMSNIHVSPYVLSTLIGPSTYCSRVIYINHKNKFCMASPEAVVRQCSVKKLHLKFTQNSQENTCIGVSF